MPDRSPDATLRWAPWLPTAAVLIGLHGLHGAWSAIALYHLGIVFVLIVRRREPVASLTRGLRPLAWPAVAACAAVGLLLPVLWPRVALDPTGLRAALDDLGLVGWRWPAFMAYYVLANPILEEVFWRDRLAPPTGRPHWRDLAFATYHGVVLWLFLEPGWILLALAGLMLAAWVWRLMARRWGGLAAPVACHLAADLAIVLAAHRLAESAFIP